MSLKHNWPITFPCHVRCVPDRLSAKLKFHSLWHCETAGSNAVAGVIIARSKVLTSILKLYETEVKWCWRRKAMFKNGLLMLASVITARFSVVCCYNLFMSLTTSSAQIILPHKPWVYYTNRPIVAQPIRALALDLW